MKVVDVKEQVRPPLKRCVELVLSGVKYRIFRAAITVCIIALAVAFLMTMLGESLITRRVARAVDAETAPGRLLQFWVGRLSGTPDLDQLCDTLAGLSPGSEPWKEMAGWGGLDEPQMARLVDVARREQAYNAFFRNLSDGKRRNLTERYSGDRVFREFFDSRGDEPASLREPRLADFNAKLDQVNEIFPSDKAAFRTFLTDWRETDTQRRRIIQAHGQALALLAGEGGPLRSAKPTALLARCGETDLQALQAAGFRLNKAQVDGLRKEAALAHDAEQIERMLSSGMLRAEVAKWTDSKTTEINPQMLVQQLQSVQRAKDFVALTDSSKGLGNLKVLTEDRLKAAARVGKLAGAELAAAQKDDPDLVRDAQMLRGLTESPLIRDRLSKRLRVPADQVTPEKLLDAVQNEAEQGAAWLRQLLGSVPPLEPLGLSVEQIQAAARHRLESSRLNQIAGSMQTVAAGKTFVGFSTRTLWLLVVSFLVCVVGIANAMLMSVTERFREIATIKCLGATDGFIMINFVLESVMQGLVGSLAGLVLGALLGALRSWASWGLLALEHMPWLELAGAAALSFVLGIGISALAAVYPAWVAARLAPMEAMRIE